MKTRRFLAVIAATAALALAACTTTDSTDNPATTTIVETAPTRDNTQLVVDLSWEQQTEADRNAMCDGITLFGPEWAAEQMQLGAGGGTAIDWDRAAVLVEQKCAQR